MRYTEWLRKQVARLEEELRGSAIFESTTAPSRDELKELRSKVVVHTYMKQQLLQRDTNVFLDVDPEISEDVDTQEFELVWLRPR